MEARELRIGNLLLFGHSVVRVEGVNDYLGVEVRDQNDDLSECSIGILSPIPLTEEWLEKFGFEVKVCTGFSTGLPVDFNVYQKNGLTYNSIQGKWWLEGRLLRVKLNYAHQLQNLYFSLTGQELEVKEKTPQE